MAFLPEGYKAPEKPSTYWNKWKQGQNKFRALGSAIAGWEWWVNEADGSRKPVRVKTIAEVPNDKLGKGEDKAKFFWKFPAWNYSAEQIQILDIKQRSIQEDLEENYINNPAWGDLTQYDVIINRKGETLTDTKYTVTALPHRPIDSDITEKYKTLHINMQAFYVGEDPFTSNATANEQVVSPVDFDDISDPEFAK